MKTDINIELLLKMIKNCHNFFAYMTRGNREVTAAQGKPEVEQVRARFRDAACSDDRTGVCDA